MAVHTEWTLDAVVAAYEQHLRHTRGVCDATLRFYSKHARQFLRAVLGYDPLDLTRLRPAAVIEYVSAKANDHKPKTVKGIGTMLRSLFRFLGAAGLHDGRLEEVVPVVPEWRLATLPRHLDEEQHARLLASLDVSTPCRRRDRAMILCLSALGLRAGEVAGLRIDDIDWRAGTVTIRSRKTRRGAHLPLPPEVGRAIVGYLRHGRPKTDDRHVFVLHHIRVGAPMHDGTVVSQAVDKALHRAEIAAPSFGAHLLRHTLATRMVRRGASLKEIADVLGHSSLAATGIYAKTDVPSLADVAMPWPEVTP
jgi:site-specific recombinase XerD